MAVPLSADEYQAAIDNLTEHLDRALARNDLIVLPRVVWKPFKQPTENVPGNALRHLSQQFTGRNASNLFKLSPQVFVHLVSILLCATNSAKQDRLLHALISALRTWTDHEAIWAAIRRKKIKNIDKDAVLHHSTILRRDLTKIALRALISSTLDLEARRCAAQMLAIAIKNHNETRQCMTAVDCAHLGQLVQVHDDYVLRFLAADVLRELLSNGTDPESCWPPNTSRAIIDPFPVASNTSTVWLLDAQDHISDIDKHMGFHWSRMSVFRVKKCHHWKDAGSSQEDTMMENILVCLSSHVNCIIADESNGLYVASYPVLGQQSMSVIDEPSADKSSATLTVEFANDEGCRVTAGTKEAVRGLQLELESPGQAAKAAKILRELQQTAEQQHQADSAEQNTEDVLAPNPRKRSIAIIDLSSSPRQEAMNASRQAGYAADQSDTYPLSPLQQKTDQLATANEVENMIDEMATPEDSAQVVNGPSKSFQEKMRAGDQVAGSNRAKQRKAPESRGLQGLQDVKPAPLPPSVSGTLKTSDKNPPQNAQKRTSSKGLEQRSNETRTHLRQTHSSVRPSRTASSSLEAYGSHLKYIEKSDATEPQDARVTSQLSKKNVVKPLSKERMATPREGQLQALKRPKPGTRGSRNEFDWDEDIRDLRDFDIPEDEEPQPKKARVGGKKSAGKTTAGKSSQVISSSRFKMPSLPKSTSKAPNGKSGKKTKPVSVTEKAFAPRRSRRNKKAQAYDEPEDSDMQDSSAEEDEMQSLRGKAEDTTSQTEASPKNSTPFQATSDDYQTNAKSQTSNLAKSDEARSQRKTLSHAVGTSAQHPIEFSYDSASGADRSPEPSGSGGLQTTAPAASTVQSDKSVEPDVELAEDLYPMSKADVDAAASAAKGDFTDNLKAFLYPPGDSAPTNNQNSPAQPKTPFGDKTRFLQNVNASKSAKSTRSPQLSAAGAHHPSTSANIGDENSDGYHQIVKKNLPPSTHVQTEPSKLKTTVVLAGPDAKSQQLENDLSHSGSDSKAAANSEDDLVDKGWPEVDADPPEVNAPERLINPVTDQATASHLNSTRRHDTRRVSERAEKDAPEQAIGPPPANRASSTETRAGGVVRQTTLDSHSRGSGTEFTVPKVLPQATITHKTPKKVSKVSESNAVSTAFATSKARPKKHRSSEITPANEKTAQKTPVIGFSSLGPLNQGRSVGSTSMSAGSLFEQKSKYETFKRSAAREPPLDEATPSSIGGADIEGTGEEDEELVVPDKSSELHSSSSKKVTSFRAVEIDEDHGFPAQETDSVEHGVEHHGNDHHSDETPQDYPSDDVENEEDALEEVDGSTVESPEIASTLQEVESDDEDRNSGSMGDTEKEEASERGISQSAVIDESAIQVTNESTRIVRRATRAGKIERQENNHSFGSRTAGAEAPERSPPQSLDFGALLDSTFPEAQQNISTKVFRQQVGENDMGKGRTAERKLGARTINPLHPTSDHSNDTSKQVTASASPANHIETLAKHSALAPDHTAMPPPPKKELQGATLQRAISKPGHRLTENDLKANELTPTTTHLTKRSNGCGTYARIMEKPARLPSGTPATFHANMRDELEHSENARHSHESPMEPDDYEHEANDRTLVNDEAEDLGPCPDFSRPVFRKNYGTTASTNDNSSIAGEEERAEKVADRAAWANGVRSSHQDLFGLVMQMTRDVLFCLGAEEDAIAAKQSNFDRGAELITNNLLKSWNDRLGHEMNRLVGDVEAERHRIEQIDLRARPSRDNETAQVKIPKEIELQELRKRLQKKDKKTQDLLKKLI